MGLSNRQIVEIVKIIATAIISVFTTLFAVSCTASMSISKYNSNSTQDTHQTATSQVDSARVSVK